MKMERVVSNTLRSVGYEDSTKTLQIEFQQGGVYQYFGVPESLYRELMLSSSKGMYFNRNVKNHFASREIGIE